MTSLRRSTDQRLIMIDKQGLTGSKVSYHSVLYRNITQFSVETAGTFDSDAELKIWVTGAAAPLTPSDKAASESIDDLYRAKFAPFRPIMGRVRRPRLNAW